jgi:SPASM domain peptide maturase of grasp-with-spasm system
MKDLHTNTSYLIYNKDVLIAHGATNMLLLDVARNNAVCVPLSYSSVLKAIDTLSIAQLFSSFDELDHSNLETFIVYLIRNDFAWLSEINHNANFEPISTEWHTPNIISNAVIELNKPSFDLSDELFLQLQALSCKNIQIHLFFAATQDQIMLLNEICQSYSIHNCELFTCYEPSIDYVSIFNTCLRFSKLFITGANYYKEISNQLFFLSEKKADRKACGYIAENEFVRNIPHFTESQHHNTCLNRKISIDEHGEIRNCPSMPKSWGNIKDTKLIDVVNNPEFQKLWHIKKDDISKCKDCEFRHICTDCRAYREDPDDLYSAPLKCGYDPYTGVWEEWSTNPLKQKAIEFYGMEELVKERQDKLKVKNEK